MIPDPHLAIIPGLDYCLCQRCKRWIATEYELDAINRRIDKITKASKNPSKSKELEDLRSKLKEVNYQRRTCKRVDR